jgi:hypothetical protein
LNQIYFSGATLKEEDKKSLKEDNCDVCGGIADIKVGACKKALCNFCYINRS